MEQLNLFSPNNRTPGLDPTSMNYRLNAAGIKTIREGKTVYLEYNGKRIFRPQLADKCPDVVKREFGIEI